MTAVLAGNRLQLHRSIVRQKEDETSRPKKKLFAPENILGERLALFTQPQTYTRQRAALES